MTTLETLTTKQIKILRDEAGSAGDMVTVDICDVALCPLESSNSDGTPLVDSQGNPMTRTEAREMIVEIISENEANIGAGVLVEGGQRGTQDYDTGRVIEVDGGRALVAWDGSATKDWCPTSVLRVITVGPDLRVARDRGVSK